MGHRKIRELNWKIPIKVAIFRAILDEEVAARKRVICNKMGECLKMIETASEQINKVRDFIITNQIRFDAIDATNFIIDQCQFF